MQRVKYNNKKVMTPDGEFDSRKESMRFYQLRTMELEGQISDLQRQVEFELIPKQKISSGTLRPIKYIADFVYMKDGEKIVEDVKPTGASGKISASYKSTPAWKEYMIKKKLMMFINQIEVKEI